MKQSSTSHLGAILAVVAVTFDATDTVTLTEEITAGNITFDIDDYIISTVTREFEGNG